VDLQGGLYRAAGRDRASNCVRQAEEELSQPGLHFHWWPIETVEKANTAEKLVNIGDAINSTGGTGLMLSGDQNIVDVRFSVAYQVSDPEAYLFNVDRPDGMVRQVAESAMREVGRPPPGAGHLPRRPPGHRRRRAHHRADTLDGMAPALPSTRSRSRTPRRRAKWPMRSTRCSAPSRTRTVSSRKPTSIPTRSSAARGEAAQVREEAAAYKNRVVQEATG
jgi:membrane protease subunit HflK